MLLELIRTYSLCHLACFGVLDKLRQGSSVLSLDVLDLFLEGESNNPSRLGGRQRDRTTALNGV